MKAWRIKKLKQRIRDDFVTNHTQKISICDNYGFVPLMNHKCHFNSVHALISGKTVAVIECAVVDADEITAHYISQLENGDYIDYTLGWSWAGADYRFVRIVPTTEHGDATKMLGDFKARLCDRHLNWFDRKILNIEGCDLV